MRAKSTTLIGIVLTCVLEASAIGDVAAQQIKPATARVWVGAPTKDQSVKDNKVVPLQFAFFDKNDNLVFRFEVTTIKGRSPNQTAEEAAAAKAQEIFKAFNAAMAALGAKAPDITMADPADKKDTNLLAFESGFKKIGDKEVPVFTSLRVSDDTTGESVRGTRGDVQWKTSVTLKSDPSNDTGLAMGQDSQGGPSVVQAGIGWVDDATGLDTNLYTSTFYPLFGMSPYSIEQWLAMDFHNHGFFAGVDPLTNEFFLPLPANEYFYFNNTDVGLAFDETFAAVPEPTSLALLVLGICALVRRGSRTAGRSSL